MKVRHKELMVELEVRREKVTLLHVGGNFYETVGGSFIAHHDPAWELVRGWEDITGLCEVSTGGFLTCEGHTLAHGNSRFVKLDASDGPCFIIERRKP